MSLRKIANIGVDVLGYTSGIGLIGLIVVTVGYLLIG
jgi:hypothetical protein